MLYSNLSVLSLAGRHLDYVDQRQKLLSQNIANTDTPHYRPTDFKDFVHYSGLPRKNKLEQTGTHHGHFTYRNAPDPKADAQRTTYEISQDGNEVQLDEQLIKLAANSSAHRLTTNLYNKHVTMLRLAIGRPTGA
ncbi:MAG: flagellar basal body rod protein FlgB [Pseudomonadota bacterium]